MGQLKLGIRVFRGQSGFGIESMRGRWDAKYNPQDPGI